MTNYGTGGILRFCPEPLIGWNDEWVGFERATRRGVEWVITGLEWDDSIMKSSILPLLLVIAGGVLYHVSQKSIERTASPLGVVIYAYAVGIVLCLVAGVFDPVERAGWLSPRQIDWAVVGVGVGAVLIEVGFMLTYRVGWDLGVASVLSSVLIALLLLPVGVIFFREHLTLRMVIGIGFCLLGLVLLARK